MWNWITSCHIRFEFFVCEFSFPFIVSSCSLRLLLLLLILLLLFLFLMSSLLKRCKTIFKCVYIQDSFIRISANHAIISICHPIHENLSINAFIWFCATIQVLFVAANWNCHPLCGSPLYVYRIRINDEALISTNQHTHTCRDIPIHAYINTCTRNTHIPNDAIDNWFISTWCWIASSNLNQHFSFVFIFAYSHLYCFYQCCYCTHKLAAFFATHCNTSTKKYIYVARLFSKIAKVNECQL